MTFSNLNLLIVAFSCLVYYFSHLKLIYAQNEGDLLWGYSAVDGPQLWCTVLHEGQCCSHLRQSPINIKTNDVKFTSDELHLFNYNTTAHRIVLANNGRTAVVHLFEGRKTPYLRLSSGKVKFGLNSFHFHWGSHDNNGSEHSINDHRYPLEMHLVHVNQKYQTLEVAREHPDGIAVIALFLQITERPSKQYDKLIKSLAKVEVEGEHVDVRNRFTLDSLFPSEMDVIYAYRGSLTTPPCSEAVTWFIIDTPATISREQLAAFRQLQTTIKPLTNNSAVIQLVDNFRPQQELHQRLIFKLKGMLNS